MVSRVLIVDFMYLWNRVYAIKGRDTVAHIYNSFKYVDDSDYYDEKLIVLDGLHSTNGRRKIHADYKTNRGDKSKLYQLMNVFLDAAATSYKTLEFLKNDEYEADDLITALVKNYEDADKYIYSGDTDLYQLLRFPRTYIGTKYTKGMIIKPIKTEDANNCYKKRYKLDVENPSYIIKCKTFKGDTSDNIPIACPGMKSKTINYLISEFWSNDEPLNSTILFNMAKYLKSTNTKEFNNFYENRASLIRNYKLCQLGYSESSVLENTKQLREDGTWQ